MVSQRRTDVLDIAKVPSSKSVLNGNPYYKHLFASELPAHARHFHKVTHNQGSLTLHFSKESEVFKDPKALYPDIDQAVDAYLDGDEIPEGVHPSVKKSY